MKNVTGKSEKQGIDYDLLADELAANDFCIIDNFIDKSLVKKLLDAILFHRNQDNFQKAGIGKFYNFAINKEIRGDYIKWIEKSEALPATLEFVKQIEVLMGNFNRLLFLSLKDYECHFAIYPSGTFYERHLDQFKGSNNRKISFALYLNENWISDHAGELRLYVNDAHLDIEPLAGRLAIFRSDTVEHEVLTSRAERFSITGWMLDRPVDLPYI